MNEVFPGADGKELSLSRWLQVPIGILLGLFTLLCLVGSLVMVFVPNEKAPFLAPALGVVFTLVCCWVLEKCVRLVMGWRSAGGLMGPRALRLVAWLVALLPVGGLFTGYFLSNPLQATVQTVFYVAVFFGLRRLAATKSADET